MYLHGLNLHAMALAMLLGMGWTALATACTTNADCADGNVCNGSEACQAGVCIPGTPITCNDGSGCTLDSCDPVNGCTYTPANGCLLAGKKFRLAIGSDMRMAFQTGPQQMAGGDFPANYTEDDPIVHGASLRVLTGAGDMFDNTYPLPRSNWEYLKVPGTNVGYRYRDLKGQYGPVTLLIIRNAKPSKLKARGAALNFTLGANPDPVKVALRFGNAGRRYCLQFGGRIRFLAGTGFTALAAPAPTACPACSTAAHCDDGDPCTADSCAAGVCQNSPVANGTACTDGNACTQADVCQAGACAGAPILCGASDACHVGACDTVTGLCTSPPAPDGSPCDDGDACTTGDACLTGTCVGSPITCAPPLACIAGACS
jgi:hypothetical protein